MSFFEAKHFECDEESLAIRKFFKRAGKMKSIPDIVFLLQGRILTNTLTPDQKSSLIKFLTGKPDWSNTPDSVFDDISHVDAG